LYANKIKWRGNSKLNIEVEMMGVVSLIVCTQNILMLADDVRGRNRSSSFADNLSDLDSSDHHILSDVADEYLSSHDRDEEPSPRLPKKTLEIFTKLGKVNHPQGAEAVKLVEVDPGKKPGSKRDFEYHVKVLLLGDSGVGKTSLMCRFADNEFQANLMSTAGVDFRVRYLRHPDKKAKVKCQIWDTAGQERFHVITRAYYRDSHGIALVYDVTNEHSFEQISYWMNNIKSHAGEEVQVVIFGNKIDMENRKITFEQGQEIAKKYNALFYETSAKDGTNVVDAFQALSKHALKKIDERLKLAVVKSANKPEVRGVSMKNHPKRRACTIL